MIRHYQDTKYERPAVRGANGQFLPHRAYEGWNPHAERERPDVAGWVLVAICAAVALAALRGLGHV